MDNAKYIETRMTQFDQRIKFICDRIDRLESRLSEHERYFDAHKEPLKLTGQREYKT